MELLDYTFGDNDVTVETIHGDHQILLDDFWEWVMQKERNTYFASHFSQVLEETIEVAGVFKNVDEYITNSRTKDLEQDLTDYINEKITHNRNTDLIPSES